MLRQHHPLTLYWRCYWRLALRFEPEKGGAHPLASARRKIAVKRQVQSGFTGRFTGGVGGAAGNGTAVMDCHHAGKREGMEGESGTGTGGVDRAVSGEDGSLIGGEQMRGRAPIAVRDSLTVHRAQY